MEKRSILALIVTAVAVSGSLWGMEKSIFNMSTTEIRNLTPQQIFAEVAQYVLMERRLNGALRSCERDKEKEHASMQKVIELFTELNTILSDSLSGTDLETIPTQITNLLQKIHSDYPCTTLSLYDIRHLPPHHYTIFNRAEQLLEMLSPQ